MSGGIVQGIGSDGQPIPIDATADGALVTTSNSDQTTQEVLAETNRILNKLLLAFVAGFNLKAEELLRD